MLTRRFGRAWSPELVEHFEESVQSLTQRQYNGIVRVLTQLAKGLAALYNVLAGCDSRVNRKKRKEWPRREETRLKRKRSDSGGGDKRDEPPGGGCEVDHSRKSEGMDVVVDWERDAMDVSEPEDGRSFDG